jgi:glycosyltransferase involved in cell wall biosynthesis
MAKKNLIQREPMSKPRISVVVPTLRRSDTLRHCLRTLVSQDFQDCEFVIQNNGNDPATEAAVNEIQDERFRHFATEAVLPMMDNWEAALANSRGEILTFIGDDDGLLPDACSIAASFFAGHNTELLSWSPYWYFWPEYFHAGFRNRILAEINLEFTAEEISSRAELSRVFSYIVPYAQLPMIYNSFVHRRLIERIRGELGRYFIGLAPDITSGLVNAARTESFVRLSRPLSMTGTSQHSTGHNVAYRGDREKSSAIMRRDFCAVAEDYGLPDGNFLQIGIARDLLFVKDQLFPDDPFITLNYSRLMQSIADSINDHPDAYDELRDAIKTIGAKHGIDASEIFVPPRTNSRNIPELGINIRGPARISLVMDGNAIGIRGIDQAIELIVQLVPRAFALNPVVRKTELQPGETLVFTSNGNGLGTLIDGWGEPESGGTWSVGKRSVLRFRVAPSHTPLWIHLRCTPFLHAIHPKLDVICSIGKWTQPWHFSIEQEAWTPSFAIPLSAIDTSGFVTITLSILNPLSPAVCNVNRDTRLLGIWLHSIDVLEEPLRNLADAAPE